MLDKIFDADSPREINEMGLFYRRHHHNQKGSIVRTSVLMKRRTKVRTIEPVFQVDALFETFNRPKQLY
ncbi:MAG: hypothetical protein ACMG55_14155 [Microcoleus sp.]